jgi:hypothetical protein
MGVVGAQNKKEKLKITVAPSRRQKLDENLEIAVTPSSRPIVWRNEPNFSPSDARSTSGAGASACQSEP